MMVLKKLKVVKKDRTTPAKAENVKAVPDTNSHGPVYSHSDQGNKTMAVSVAAG